jgi:hypothetical protein
MHFCSRSHRYIQCLFITDVSLTFDRYGKDDRRYHLTPQLYFGESSCGLLNIRRKDICRSPDFVILDTWRNFVVQIANFAVVIWKCWTVLLAESVVIAQHYGDVGSDLGRSKPRGEMVSQSTLQARVQDMSNMPNLMLSGDSR